MRVLTFRTDGEQMDPMPAQLLREIGDQIKQKTVIETFKKALGPPTFYKQGVGGESCAALKEGIVPSPLHLKRKTDKETLPKGQAESVRSDGPRCSFQSTVLTSSMNLLRSPSGSLQSVCTG